VSMTLNLEASANWEAEDAWRRGRRHVHRGAGRPTRLAPARAGDAAAAEEVAHT
jgi:hypothetical protein